FLLEFFILILLALQALHFFLSMTLQSPAPEPHYAHDPNPPFTLVLTILLLVIFFLGFFSIYFCKCLLENVVNSINTRRTPHGPAIDSTKTVHGLDFTIVSSFPTFTYSSVKQYQREKYSLECAICLCDFDDHDLLRLLTTCSHVFHQDCIDLWFQSHKSCPICRRNLDVLDSTQLSETNSNVDETTTNGNVIEIVADRNNVTVDNDNVINIVIEDENKDDNEDVFDKRGLDISLGNEKFPRSHSTGHSILRKRFVQEDDKYKLKLPDHVKEIIVSRHIVTLSATTFGEIDSNSTNIHKGFGEISSCTTQIDVI
ncbi:RING-H2 finger protein ATL29, partial [Amaranthus tricolor]|uniref:RING-H2 finger protein ATL29 n=1 Tax=Amaranthus tricolor TaxID=29722 RepID=UPI002589EB0C